MNRRLFYSLCLCRCAGGLIFCVLLVLRLIFFDVLYTFLIFGAF